MARLPAVLIAICMASTVLAQAAKPAPARPPTTQPIKTPKQMLSPTLISLQCKAASSEAAVALLEKQVGFSLEARTREDRADDQGKITCNLVNQPYWSVIRDVCVQGDLRVSTPQAKRAAPFALALRRDANRDFMYFPTKVDSSLVPAVVDLSHRRGGPTGDRLQLRISMLAEPKVFIAGYKRQATIELATDEAGNSLVIPPDQMGPGGVGGGFGGGRFGRRGPGAGPGGGNNQDDNDPSHYSAVPRHNQFPTLGPSIRPAAKTIKRLKGSATLVFGFDLVTQDVSGLLNGGTERISLGRTGAIVLTAYGPDPANRQVLFNVTLPRVKLPNGNWTDETLEFRSMRFIMTDDKGNSFGYTGLHNQNVNNNEVSYTANFEWPWGDNGQFESRPVKVTCILPTRLEEAVIPFEFADIPMPVEQPAANPPAAR